MADWCSLAHQVLGLYPAEDAPALTGAKGQQLALLVNWQQPSAGAGSAAPRLTVSLGQVFAAYVPDLVLDTLRAAGLAPGAAIASGQAAPVRSQHDSQAGQQGTMREPPAWLAGGAFVTCSVVSVQLAALSGAGPQCAAAVALLSEAGCTAHLGPLRASAWQGGLLEGLLSMLAGAPAGSKLDVRVVGARLGVATAWRATKSRREASDMAGAGISYVCEDIQVQCTVALATPAQEASMHAALAESEGQPSSAAGPPATSYAGGSGDTLQHDPAAEHTVTGSSSLAAEVPHTWAAECVLASPVELQVSDAQLAALACTAGGLSAKLSRGLSRLLPQAGVPSAAEPDGSAPWSVRLGVKELTLCTLWRPARANEAAASLPSSAIASCSTLLSCAEASVVAKAGTGPPEKRRYPAVTVALAQLRMLSTGARHAQDAPHSPGPPGHPSPPVSRPQTPDHCKVAQESALGGSISPLVSCCIRCHAQAGHSRWAAQPAWRRIAPALR